MRKLFIGICAAASTAAALMTSHVTAQTAKVDAAQVDRAVESIFGKTPPVWKAKIDQDETQKVCSLSRNEPSAAEATAILEREKKNVVMPADGKVIGDWKSGEKLSQSGYGGRHTDDPTLAVGGNCYACHQLSKTELSYGTMGPPLVEYGKIRRYAEADAKAAYVKIFNAQAVFPCSNMPRLGHSKHLSEQQIKDIVALLFDPESPVNK